MNQDNYTIEDDDNPSWQSYSIEEIEQSKEIPENEEPENLTEKTISETEDVDFSMTELAIAMGRILITPVEGWKSFKRLRIPFQTVNSRLLFPLIGTASLAAFLGVIIWNDKSVKEAIPVGLGIFCSLFFGYFCAYLFSKLLLTKEGKDAMEGNFGKAYISMVFSTFSLFAIFYEALQVLQPILVFMPLWTIYIILKGVRFLGIPQEVQARTATTLSVLVLGLPLAVDWILSFVL